MSVTVSVLIVKMVDSAGRCAGAHNSALGQLRVRVRATLSYHIIITVDIEALTSGMDQESPTFLSIIFA
jgi:hypothetical protein